MNPEDTFQVGDIVTDNGEGFPWIKTVGGWLRQGLDHVFTWREVLAWHEYNVVNPDDDALTGFVPVKMVPDQKGLWATEISGLQSQIAELQGVISSLSSCPQCGSPHKHVFTGVCFGSLDSVRRDVDAHLWHYSG